MVWVEVDRPLRSVFCFCFLFPPGGWVVVVCGVVFFGEVFFGDARARVCVCRGGTLMPMSDQLPDACTCLFRPSFFVFVFLGRVQVPDVSAMKAAMTRNTILIVGSAPQYPHGVMDPIVELGKLALAAGCLMHVDSCYGGFVLPWLKAAGSDVPDWVFPWRGL